MKPNPTVLLLDEDRANRRLMRLLLASQNYRVVEADNGRDGLAVARTSRPDVIILDLALPELDGVAVLRRLRSWSQAPVLALNSAGQTEGTVAALDAGANDCLSKPFGELELLARLRVLCRCLPGEWDEPVLVGEDIIVDSTRNLTVLNGHKLDLTPTEQALLHVLVAYAGKVVSSSHLLRSVWGADEPRNSACLRVFISHLRKKLEETGGKVAIETRGLRGYRLQLHCASARD